MIDGCCVCGKPIEGVPHSIGSRQFCDYHFSRATRNSFGLALLTAAIILGLGLFVVVSPLLASRFHEYLNGNNLVVVGIVFALVPAALWMAAFYVLDRIEPEPKIFIFGIFLLGGLLAGAVGQPLIDGLFQVNEWSSRSIGLRLLQGILIVGVIQEFLKYAAVRYTIFHSQEFDQRIDGIVYGAAAGLGYATMLNITYIIDNGGVELSIGAIRIVVNALAHASFAAVTGYFIGRAKFEDMGILWLPIGLLLATLLNAIVTLGLEMVSYSQLQATPIKGVVFAGAVSIATFAVLFWIVQRNNKAAVALVRE